MQSWESNVTRVCEDHGKQGYLKQGQERIDTERETEREREIEIETVQFNVCSGIGRPGCGVGEPTAA